ncbi:MAG: molybdenum cofactor guanylyltransferase [Dehalococcoidia bacterium]|nr:molybdenum cofactor guanylyltransferase [Dehalococcoidia bacterium]
MTSSRFGDGATPSTDISVRHDSGVTSIILAGGLGVRFGRNKVWEVFGGKRLVERVIECLAPLSSRIMVVTSERQAASFQGSGLESNLVIDLLPGRGPLGGIYTGLSASESPLNIVVASDMPFLNRDLLAYMLSEAQGYDMVVPRSDDFVEPLHAIYSKGCAPVMESLVDENRFTIRQLMRTVKVRDIGAAELDRFDPQRLSFFNIDTQQDMERATRLLEENPALQCSGVKAI